MREGFYYFLKEVLVELVTTTLLIIGALTLAVFIVLAVAMTYASIIFTVN